MKITEITFKTSDNILLQGLDFSANETHTRMLLFLGLGGNAKSKSVKYFASALAKKGISTTVFSSRGHNDSAGLFTVKKNISDVQELEKKYSSLANKKNNLFFVAGHSIGGRSLLYANISSDVVLINPTLFRAHPKFVTLPIIRRLYLAIWNFFVFRTISFTHFGSVYFSNEAFSDLMEHSNNNNFPSSKLKGSCLLLISSQDVVARYDSIDVREKVRSILRKRYSSMHDIVFDGLDHEFSDGMRTFMRTYEINKIVNIFVSFSRNKR